MLATRRGSIAMGYALSSQATASRIQSTGHGTLGGGYANGADIEAAVSGAFAWGSTFSYRIFASGYGNLAFGYADTAAIEATAYGNCFQFGPGTNALADTLQVGGAGIRFKGTVGVPGALQNGDMWVDAGGNVLIRSAGASVVIA
jgi:hypothetical protein